MGETSLYLGRSDDGGGTWESVPSIVDTVGNTITTMGITSFSLWAIGADGAVPVELTAFSGSVMNNDVILKWNTTSETNNFGFEILRRYESEEYNKIGFSKGNGTTNRPHTYRYICRPGRLLGDLGR